MENVPIRMRQFRHSKYAISLGFVLVLSLLVAVAVIGLTRMTAIQSRMDSIVNQQNVKTELAGPGEDGPVEPMQPPSTLAQIT